MRFDPIKCPECHELAIGSVETVPGIALFMVFDDGVEYDGMTKIYWDGQTTDRDEDGKALLQCCNDHTWFAAQDDMHECKTADGSIVRP